MARTLGLPLSVGRDGTLTTLEQGTPDELAQSVSVLVQTRLGERAAIPGYGLSNPLGRGLDAGATVAQVTEWEDRADPADLEMLLDTIATQDARLQGTLTTGQA